MDLKQGALALYMVHTNRAEVPEYLLDKYTWLLRKWVS